MDVEKPAHKKIVSRKRFLEMKAEPVHVEGISATRDAGLAGTAAKQVLKHDKDLNRGMPDEQKFETTKEGT